MISVVIKGPTFKQVYKQILQAQSDADIIELRLDFFESLNLEEIKKLKTTFSIPMIFTIRSHSQGGHYRETETQRLLIIEKLATLKPDFIDLEYNISKKFVEKIMKQHPEIKIIISLHDFIQTPSNLYEVLETLKKIPAHYYKIATMTHSSLDALRLLRLAKESKVPVIAIGMGVKGDITRILNIIFGSPFTYASLDGKLMTAPDQLSLKTLLDIYHHNKINKSTEIYGLIGNPIEQSVSDISHNAVLNALDLDAIYVKIPLCSEELGEFFDHAKALGIKGLSVTIPLKESVLPYLDKIIKKAKNIGAVNTIEYKDGLLIGYNTDALGALKAIHEKENTLIDKKVIIIGAGGAAKAIAYEMQRQKALVSIINKTKYKAQKLAALLGCTGNGLEYIKKEYSLGYDIIINCTSSSMPIDLRWILPKSIVMDINVNPKNTKFLQSAQDKDCLIIYGYKMFLYQASAQFKIWFKEKINQKTIESILEKTIVKLLSI